MVSLLPAEEGPGHFWGGPVPDTVALRITGTYFCSASSTRISSEWSSQSPKWWCWRPVAGSRSSVRSTTTVLRGARRSATSRPDSVRQEGWTAPCCSSGLQGPLLGERPQKHSEGSQLSLLFPSHVHNAELRSCQWNNWEQGQGNSLTHSESWIFLSLCSAGVTY